METLYNFAFPDADRGEIPSQHELAAIGDACADSNVRLAVHLLSAALAVDDFDGKSVAEHLHQASDCMGDVIDPRLRWWYHHLRGAQASLIDASFDQARAEFEIALDIARDEFALYDELELSTSLLLFCLRRLGDGEAVAATLLNYLQEKPTTAVGRQFFSMAADTLFWLREFELASRIRQRAVEIAPTSASANDHRELARTLIELDRFDEAATHLIVASALVEHPLKRQRLLEIEVQIELAAATNDVDLSVAGLDQIEAMNLAGHDRVHAALCVAKLHVDRGDAGAAGEVLETVDVEDTAPEERWRYFSLLADIKAADGDYERAVELVDHARRLSAGRRPRTGHQAKVIEALTPWLLAADPGSYRPTEIGSQKLFRSRWLTSTARDIRRAMAPALFALDSDVSVSDKVAALETMIDELTLIGGFLADATAGAASSDSSDFWALYPIARRMIDQHQATLVMSPPPGTAPQFEAGALAGRATFGVVAIIADHATPDTTIRVELGTDQVTVEGSSIPVSAVQRIQSDLQHLRAAYPIEGERVPPRSALLATCNAVISRGWSVSWSIPRPGSVTVSIAVPPSESNHDDYPVQPLATTESDYQYSKAEWPSPHLDVSIELKDRFERRHEGAGFDPDLLWRAVGAGDPRLQCTALLVSAILCTRHNDRQRANELLVELRVLLEEDPSLEVSLAPSIHHLHNIECLVAEGRGDYVRRWESAARDIVGRERTWGSHPDGNIAIFNWAVAEYDRGALGVAWHYAHLCDPAGSTLFGRCLELAIRTRICLVEGDLEQAASFVYEALAISLVDGDRFRAEAVTLQVVVEAARGNFEIAWRALAELAADPDRQASGEIDGLKARILAAQGRSDEALAACQRARLVANRSFGYQSLKTVVGLEAEILAAEGRSDEAAEVLELLPIDAQRLHELWHRLVVERRVAKAQGDGQRRFDAARHQLDFVRGRPRFEPSDLGLAAQLVETLEGISTRTRARLDAERTAVASVVAHDMRNALGALALDVELLTANGSTQERFDRIEMAIQPIGTLADQLDAVATWDGSSLVAEVDVVRLDDLLESIRHPAQDNYQRTGGDLTVTADIPRGLKVRVHRNMLEIVLRNLIGNAVKHGRPAGTIRITVGYDRTGTTEMVTFAIEDDGPGLPLEQARRLVDHHDRTLLPGPGLGLWIVRHYSHMLGLEIRTGTSELGGAKVEVVVPVISARSFGPNAPRTRLRRAGEPGRRFLIVEDDPMLLLLLREALETAGMTALVATTANEAVQAIEAGDAIDVVVADIELADGSTGFDVLAALQERDLSPAFVAMSGQSQRQVCIDAARLFGYVPTVLQKPFTLEALFGAIDKATAAIT